MLMFKSDRVSKFMYNNTIIIVSKVCLVQTFQIHSLFVGIDRECLRAEYYQ